MAFFNGGRFCRLGRKDRRLANLEGVELCMVCSTIYRGHDAKFGRGGLGRSVKHYLDGGVISTEDRHYEVITTSISPRNGPLSVVITYRGKHDFDHNVLRMMCAITSACIDSF